MYIVTLWFAKIVQNATRLLGHGGAALPGLIVEKFSKNFLKHYLSKIPGGVVIVSGTNGKTTTTKLIVDVLESDSKKVFTNRSGSNMTRGLISAVISHASLFGKMPYDIAILEVDEAYAAKFAKTIPVHGVIVLNVMRDQLDRFGEIDSTAKMLAVLTESAKKFVILNADDSRVANLPVSRGVSKLYFGLEDSVKDKIKNEDNWHGLSQKNIPDLDFKLSGSDEYSCVIYFKDVEYKLESQLKGIHNHLNIVAALTCLYAIDSKDGLAGYLGYIQKVKPAFGRGETIVFEDSSISLQLVKNPSSFMQTVSSNRLSGCDTVSIVLNDSYADSRDVSWLWDVDFSIFKEAKKVFTSGSRAYDLAVRLKYEDIKTDYIELDELKMAEILINTKGNQVVFCSYTAMLRLRKFFVKRGHLEKIQ